MGAERERVAGFGRLEDGLRQAGDWYRWGPYLSERQWGTVREDYSANGDAWNYLPHDHARSRAYRWGEDGLAGFSDIEQRLCLGLALWNGRDPILKERAFGLTGEQGNHGEDVKEYWWYLDAIPSHAWNRWRYHYPQGAFPYQDLIGLVQEHLGGSGYRTGRRPRPGMAAVRRGTDHAVSERRHQQPRRPRRAYRQSRPDRHQVLGLVPAEGGAREHGSAPAAAPAGADHSRHASVRKNFSEVLQKRESEADEFYQELTPRTASDDEAMVMRQAFAGMLWSKQLFYYDVKRWLTATRASRRPRRSARTDGTRSRVTSTRSTSCRCRTSGSRTGG